MKMLLRITMPNEPFNSMIKNGTIGNVLDKIMSDLEPEAAYFTLEDGERSVLLVVNINKPGEYVKYAEPFFLEFDASIKYEIAMIPEEFRSAGIEVIGKKYT
jgi:hypothetical protein